MSCEKYSGDVVVVVVDIQGDRKEGGSAAVYMAASQALLE